MAAKIVYEAFGDTAGSREEWEAIHTAFNMAWNGHMRLAIDYKRTPTGGWHLTAREPESRLSPWQLMKAIFHGRG